MNLVEYTYFKWKRQVLLILIIAFIILIFYIIKENCPGIYVIKNSINGKIYVGKSKNCYYRLHQHMTDIKIDNRNYNENPHLLNAVKKY